MAESINILKTNNKKAQYQSLQPQIEALLEPEENLIANLANTAAVLKEAFGFFWVGFYLVQHNELVLGPFQGPLACTRIGYNKGVCGKSWATKATILVPDVNQFDGHIACSSLSQSEIVVPGINKNAEVVFVLDVDSEHVNHFSDEDQNGLENIVKFIVNKHFH